MRGRGQGARQSRGFPLGIRPESGHSAQVIARHRALAVSECAIDWQWTGGEARFRRVREYSMARNIAPHYGPTHIAAAIAVECCGRVEESIPIYRVGCDLTAHGPFSISSLGHALAALGRRDEAVEITASLKAAPIQSAADIARVYCGLGLDEEALDWLDVGVGRKCLYLLRAVGEPRFDRLRGHPRFHAVLARMGLRSAAAREA